MFDKSLSENGSIGIYESAIDSTCCYCNKNIAEGDLATFILSQEKSEKEEQLDGKIRLYIVEVHIRCTIDMAREIERIDISSLNYGDYITDSSTIVYASVSSDVKCTICEEIPKGETEAIVFTPSKINAEDIDSNVWCHPECLEDVYDSLRNIESYKEDILAREI